MPSGATAPQKQLPLCVSLISLLLNFSLNLPLKFAVAADAGSEPRRTLARLARLYSQNALAIFVADRAVERHRPRLIRRHPIRTHTALGKRSNLTREVFPRRERLAVLDDPVREAHAQCLIA